MIKYSWILPIKNEASSLPQLLSEISQTMKGKNFEIIAIDDASTDRSWQILNTLTAKYLNLKIIHLKFHHSKWATLSTGFKAAVGEIIISSDSDLQDDPKEISKLINKLNQGYQLVSGWRKIRYDPIYKVAISKLGNRLASALFKQSFKDLNSSFKVYQKVILDNLPTEGSLLRFSLLFADKLGYKIAEVPVNHRPRLYGKSKFGMAKYLRIICDLILITLLFSGSGRIDKTK